MVEFYNGKEVIEFIYKCPVDDCTNKEIICWQHQDEILNYI